MSTPDRRALLDRAHPRLSVRRQCALLSLARSGVYRPVPVEDETDLALMRRIDELFLAHPFLGSRRLARMLSREGAPVNRKRVQRLMRLMGIEALGPKPDTSKPVPGHTVYPYLLRGLTVEQPNCRVAHMPTAARAAADSGSLILEEVGDGSASNCETARRGPTHGVYLTSKLR
jgi:putative transposase